jgi:hypothetical protein
MFYVYTCHLKENRENEFDFFKIKAKVDERFADIITDSNEECKQTKVEYGKFMRTYKPDLPGKFKAGIKLLQDLRDGTWDSKVDTESLPENVVPLMEDASRVYQHLKRKEDQAINQHNEYKNAIMRTLTNQSKYIMNRSMYLYCMLTSHHRIIAREFYGKESKFNQVIEVQPHEAPEDGNIGPKRSLSQTQIFNNEPNE